MTNLLRLSARSENNPLARVLKLPTPINKSEKPQNLIEQLPMTTEMEKLLWMYIDRECTQEQKQKVEEMLESDSEVRAEYEGLLEMHYDLINLFRTKQAKITPFDRK